MSNQKRDSFHHLFTWHGASPASSPSLPPSPFTNSNRIVHLISLKLDHTNHFLWKSHFLAIFRTHDLLGYIYGTNVCPEILLNDKESIPNPTDLL